MLAHTDLKRGIRFILDGQPYEVLESSFVFKGRGSSVVQTKIKNLITGNVISKTLHPGEEFEEAEIEKIKVKFLYSHREKFFFCKEVDSSLTEPRDSGEKVKKRISFSLPKFDLPKEIIGKTTAFLKPNEIVDGVQFQEKIINIVLPIKIQLKVTEAPPGIKGDRAQGGTKTVTLETGAYVNTPLFIKQGDIVEINTETGEYVRRIE